MKKITTYILIFIVIILFFSSIKTIKAEENTIKLEFFYTKGCPSCNNTKLIINELEEKYSNNLTIIRILIKNTSSYNYTYFNETYGFRYVPAIVVLNQTDQVLFNFSKISMDDIENTIIKMLKDMGSKEENKHENNASDNDDLLTYMPLFFIIIIPPILILVLLLHNKKKKNK